MCVPLIKIHYLISVICSFHSTNMIGYNKKKTIKKGHHFFAVSVHIIQAKRKARGKPLVKCLCACELNMDVRVFEFEMK